MATAKKTTKGVVKMTPTQLREENEKLKDLLENGSRCIMCDTVKKKDKFYINTHSMCSSGITQICKDCARKIALRVDKYGDEHEPTKESCIEALRWLNKPMIESVWNASIQESENLISGKVRSNVWYSYVKNIAMGQYVGLSFFDSDMFKEKIIYQDELTESDIVNSHSGQDTYDSFLKNKADVIRLLDYDPFEKESISDQPFLYAQLLGLLDSSEEANEDMMRTSSAITIVRGFLQQSKIDDTIAKLMSDINNLEKNSATIKTLQDSKQKLTSMIKDLAAESCLSLKNTKSAKKGENTWTGKLKKIKQLNLRDYEINGFDIETCKGMQQVANISINSILNGLRLDESEYADMVAEQTKMITELKFEKDNLKEGLRILLRENLDLRDILENNGYKKDTELTNLNNFVNMYFINTGDSHE